VDIGEKVVEVAGQFTEGKYAKGIGSVINSVTQILFGRSAGNAHE
jgi:hypothetical protein